MFRKIHVILCLFGDLMNPDRGTIPGFIQTAQSTFGLPWRCIPHIWWENGNFITAGRKVYFQDTVCERFTCIKDIYLAANMKALHIYVFNVFQCGGQIDLYEYVRGNISEIMYMWLLGNCLHADFIVYGDIQV